MEDIYLRADTEAAMMTALRALGMTYTDPDTGKEGPRLTGGSLAAGAWSLDWVGTLYKEGTTPALTLTILDGITIKIGDLVPIAIKLPGFHANVRWCGPNRPNFKNLVVPPPTTPMRVWA